MSLPPLLVDAAAVVCLYLGIIHLGSGYRSNDCQFTLGAGFLSLGLVLL